MIIDYLAIGIIIICVGVIFYIAFKNFPVLSSINIETIQKYQQDKIKKVLLEERLVRKIKSFNIKKIVGTTDEKNGETSNDKENTWWHRVYNKLHSLEKKYKESIKVKSPEDIDEHEKNKKIILNQARELVEQEEYKLAEEKYIELISLDNKLNEAYEGLADVYFKMKDYEHAKELYEYLLKINSQDDENLDHLNKKIKPDIKIEEGKEIDAKSISLNNMIASYQVELGDVYMVTSEYSKALQCYQEAAKLEPNNPKNLDALLTVAIKLHDLKISEETYKKLKEVNPENEKLDSIKKEIEKLNNK